MPFTQFAVNEKYRYQNGFGSYHEYVDCMLAPSTLTADGCTDLKQ